MPLSNPQPLLPRGVWRAPYTVDQVPVLIAVDRFGNVRKHLKLRPGVDVDHASDWLWLLLDRLDPAPQLRLVAPTQDRPTREIDPALYEDARSPLAKKRYLRYLAQQAAAKMPRVTP